MAPFRPSLERIATEASCAPLTVRIATTAALRTLHRVAVTDPRNVTAALMQAYFLLGPEACYHFVALLELTRTETDPDLPWSETMNRFAPELACYRSVVDKWVDAEAEGEMPGS